MLLGRELASKTRTSTTDSQSLLQPETNQSRANANESEGSSGRLDFRPESRHLKLTCFSATPDSVWCGLEDVFLKETRRKRPQQCQFNCAGEPHFVVRGP